MVIPLCLLATLASAQASYDLRSPDKRIEVRIRTAQGVRYDVVLNGRAILRGQFDCRWTSTTRCLGAK